MKVVIQRSKNSKVMVDGKVMGEISKGMVLFVCQEKADTEATLERAAQKIINLRIFSDPINQKMNQNLEQFGGEILAISQFTLSWDGSGGNRPSFDNSMGPQKAREFFDKFCERLSRVHKVEKGVFGAHMDVIIQNDGPVTFSLSF